MSSEFAGPAPTHAGSDTHAGTHLIGNECDINIFEFKIATFSLGEVISR